MESELIEILDQHGLLQKYDANVKKVIFYIFIKRISERLNDPDLLFYHNKSLADNHPIFQYFEKTKIDEFVNKLCQKIKKTTNKLFYIKQKITLPEQSLVNDLDGSVIDQIFSLKEQSPVNPKLLKEFLEKSNLKDLFTNLSKKVC
jgi:hypothetical protein